MNQQTTPTRRHPRPGRFTLRTFLGVGGLVLAGALVLVGLVVWWVAIALPQGQERSNRESDRATRASAEEAVGKLRAAAADGTLTRTEVTSISKFWRAERRHHQLLIDARFISNTPSPDLCVRYTLRLPPGKTGNITSADLPADQEPCLSKLRTPAPNRSSRTAL